MTQGWQGREPQAWARVAAWAVLACAVPSAVWRLLMIAGWMPGTEPLRVLHEGEGGYVLGLSVAQVLAAVLVVGLVRPWGERFAGIGINRWVPVVLGTLGGTVMTWLFTIELWLGVLAGRRPDQGALDGIPLAVMVWVYAPMMLFGPLTLVAVAGYARRRSGSGGPGLEARPRAASHLDHRG